MSGNRYCLQMVSCDDDCCGSGNGVPSGSLKYAQIESGEQVVSANSKIYFNDNSFGTLELTSNGTVVLQPGTYLISLNCQVVTSGGYVAIKYFDVLSNTGLGKDCCRVSANSGSYLSNCEGFCTLKIDSKVELCINVSYVAGNPKIGDIYGSIIQIV